MEILRRGENIQGFPVETYNASVDIKDLLSEAKGFDDIYIDPDLEEMCYMFPSRGKSIVKTVKIPSGKVFGNQSLDMYEIRERLLHNQVEDVFKSRLTEISYPGHVALQEALKYMKSRNKSRYDDIEWLVHDQVEVGRSRLPRVARVSRGGGSVDVCCSLACRGRQFDPSYGLRFGVR